MSAPPSTLVWDLPTRLFHWTLVVLIALQYASGKFNLFDMRWHFWFGYATLALIGFRIVWGLFGSQTSRFTDFVRGPAAALRYVRAQMSTNPQRSIGHTPLGGWSVLALLTSVLVQAISGLFSSDDIDTDGPLVAHVSDATVKLMTRVHNWNENILLILIGLHIAAVLAYLLLKHENLIAPMISGRKQLTAAPPLRFVTAWWALAALTVCAAMIAALAWWAA